MRKRSAWSCTSRGSLAATLLLMLSAAPGSTDARFRQTPACADPADSRLWEAGRIVDVRIGFHDQTGPGGADGDVVLREANAFTNHGVSWSALQPTPNAVTGSMDAACVFSEANGLFQVGFHFAWDHLLLDDLADWVLEITEPDELRTVLRARARLIFERCPGIDRLDVLNEPFGLLNGSTLHPNHFFEVLGPDYIGELFQIVREEAPEDVELFLNENFVEYFPARATALVDLVRDLVEAGVPIDAVGLQTHLLLGEPDWALYRRTMQQIADLGLKVFVSELDVPVPRELAGRFEVQAERYRRAVETCLAVPACDTIIVWGVDDANTWLNSFDILTGPEPAPLLFDAALEPKPAYFAVREALLRGRGGDHPIGGTRLTVARVARSRSMLSFSSTDPHVVSPSAGSRNDPIAGDPGGAVVEIFLADSTLVHELPAGPGWRVDEDGVRYQGAGRSGSPFVRLRMEEGRGLRLSLRGAGFVPSAATSGLGIRIRMGSLRTCASFGLENLVTRPGQKLEAKGVTELPADCSDDELRPTP